MLKISIKKISIVITMLLCSIIAFSSCFSYQNSSQEQLNLIPKHNIEYTNFERGNVIDEGKRAIFFKFVSDYAVSEIEVEGALLDGSGNVIYTFETQSFFEPSKNIELFIRIEKDIVSNFRTVSFTNVKAYTAEDVNSNN